MSGDRNRQLVSPLVPLVSSIKIEIGLRQDKRQQTALKRRSQEIKAFLIVPPLPPRPDRPDNCLIALGTIEPRCKGAGEYRWAVTPSYLVSKERQRLLLATKRSAHSGSFCSLLSSPSLLTSPEYLLSQLMSKLLSWHIWPHLVFDHNGDPKCLNLTPIVPQSCVTARVRTSRESRSWSATWPHVHPWPIRSDLSISLSSFDLILHLLKGGDKYSLKCWWQDVWRCCCHDGLPRVEATIN